MTKASQFHLFTLKEKPTDAELMSHQLMLRAGLIAQVTSGIYSWLPLGLRALRKVEAIVCQEMEAIGCNQLLLPGVQPSELWKESGRWQDYGPELLRFQDRHQRAYCLGPTHEEIITDLVRQRVGSYRDLPLSFFQIQTKFRDEIRPRFGVMRSREFIMKDAYSFHQDAASLQTTYDDMFSAYNTIYQRIGFDYRSVDADSGSIGGNVSREFHVLAEFGEDALAIASDGDYAANVEMTPCLEHKDLSPAAATKALEKCATPRAKTVDAVCAILGATPNQLVKAMIVHAHDSTKDQVKLVGLIIRGDHRLNEVKAQNHPATLSPLQFASLDDMKEHHLIAGFIGPVETSIPCICDYSAAAMSDFICGANEQDIHYSGVNWQRDCVYTDVADLRNVCAGDAAPDGQGSIEIHRGIEVGHIFQLGTKYSDAMNALVKNQNNQNIALHMGCYGIGISRIVAALIEQRHDERGIIWTQSIAPFLVHIIALRYKDSEKVQQAADSLHQQLEQERIDVLLDDRPLRAGILFSEADLLGFPLQLVVSDRNLETGCVEIVDRATGDKEMIQTGQVLAYIKNFLH